MRKLFASSVLVRDHERGILDLFSEDTEKVTRIIFIVDRIKWECGDGVII